MVEEKMVIEARYDLITQEINELNQEMGLD